ncbi:hypothetical protein PQX77_017786 [Marasmius sp. AFHP31]|nr:hypothetical protein PQX77_017786 [Marasmius sp. AFHP31]
MASKFWPKWEPDISKWIVFFLRTLITSRNVETGVPIRDHILLSLPELLDFENKSPLSAPVKQASSPYLKPLLTQIWVYMVDTNHPHMPPWSALLYDITVLSRNHPSTPSQFPPNDLRFDLPRPYVDKVDAALGKKLLRYLQHTLNQLQYESAKGRPIAYELAELKACVLLLSEGAECFTNGRENPICIGEANHATAIQLLCRILRFLLRKCTWLHKVSIKRKEFTDAYTAVVCIMLTLLEPVGVNTPARVQYMIESGVVKTLFKAPGSFYRLGEEGADGIRGVFQERSAKLIDRIALFMVHMPPLRAVTRDDPQMWENPMVTYGIKQSEVLDNAWANLLAKVKEMDDIRNQLKFRGLCEYDECPSSREKGSRSNTEIQYVRCTGCFVAIYCSLACRKADWKSEHKEQCPRLAGEIRDGIPHLSRTGRRFLSLIVSSYIKSYAQTLTNMVKTHRRSHSSLNTLKSRHPILYLDFDHPRVPSPESAVLLSDGFPSGEDSGLTEAIKKGWEGTGSGEILVVAMFPWQVDRGGWPLDTVFGFPLVGASLEKLGQEGSG